MEDLKSVLAEPHHTNKWLSEQMGRDTATESKWCVNTQINFNAGTIANFFVFISPISEQRSIAKYLDDKCYKIDAIVANIDSQIEAYTKLKKSLISEVVTGKKRVI